MTDREKKQREILRELMEQCVNAGISYGNMSSSPMRGEPLHPNLQKDIDQAIAELNAIPTSKEVEEAVKVIELYMEMSKEFYKIQEKQGVNFTKGRKKFREDLKQALQTLIQAVNPKEEVGCKEIEKEIDNFDWNGMTYIDLAKSLLTKYSITRKG